MIEAAISSFLASAQARLIFAIGEARRIEFEPQLAQFLARQFLRALDDDFERGDRVDVFADEAGEGVEEILGPVRPSP